MGPKSNDCCPYKKRGHREIQIEKRLCKEAGREAEVKWCCHKPRNAKSYQKPGRGKEGVLPRAFRGSMALLIPWFWTSSLQSCQRINVYCFKTPNLWYFVTAATGHSYSLKALWHPSPCHTDLPSTHHLPTPYYVSSLPSTFPSPYQRPHVFFFLMYKTDQQQGPTV